MQIVTIPYELFFRLGGTVDAPIIEGAHYRELQLVLNDDGSVFTSKEGDAQPADSNSTALALAIGAVNVGLATQATANAARADGLAVQLESANVEIQRLTAELETLRSRSSDPDPEQTPPDAGSSVSEEA